MKDYVVFTLSANKKLAKDLAASLNAELGETSTRRFADGEVMVKIETSVQGKDVVLIESTSTFAQERLFELLLLIDSINRGGARTIQFFIPYFGYSRQERSYSDEPVSCQVIAQVIETANYSSLSSFDLHHPIIKSFFKKSINNLSTSPLFVDYYLNYIKEHNIDINDVVIIAPDHGSNARIEPVADKLGGKKIIMEKIRPTANVAEHLEIKEDVTGKTCIIIDDIVDTGGTIASAAKLLYKKGAKFVLVGASHGVFSGECLKVLQEANVTDLAVTNTIEKDLPEYVHVLDILPLIKKEIY